MEHWNIDDASPWISGDLDQWNKVLSHRIPVLYRRNSALFEQGEPAEHFFIIKSGRVRITALHESGMEQQFYFALSGCLIGGGMEGKTYSSSAIAIVDSFAYCVPYAEMMSYCQNDWSLTQLLIQDLVRKQNIYRHHVISLSFHQAVHRVATALLHLCQEFGQEQMDGTVWIKNRFTCQDISNLISISRVTVNIVLRKMINTGILARKGSYYFVLDIDALEELTHRNSTLN